MKFFKKIRQSIIDFQEDRRGAIAWLTVIAAVPLTVLMFYMVNTSKAVHDKTRAQDTSDMIALLHAAEGARAMNTLSMNHVSLTQAFSSGSNAAALHSVSLLQAAITAGGIFEAGLELWSTCKKWAQMSLPFDINWALFAACTVPYDLLILDLAVNEGQVLALQWKYDPHGAFKNADNSIKALNAKNKAIIDRYPEAVMKASQQIAQDSKVSAIYFDDPCVTGTSATCAVSNTAANMGMGMDLPVDKNKFPDSYTSFCAAMYFGTLGGALPVSLPGGLGNPGVSFLNGSFVRRGFDSLKGPMRGGKDPNVFLPDHVDVESGIGDVLEYYDDIAREEKRMYDGLIFSWQTGIDSAAFAMKVPIATVQLFTDYREIDPNIDDTVRKAIVIGDKLTFKLPYAQKEGNNVFLDYENILIAAMCLGDVFGRIGDSLGGLGSFADAIVPTLTQLDVYHPKEAGLFPNILPGVDTYTDHYKPLAFVFREQNKRWSPKIFANPTTGFSTYSQAIFYNPEEWTMYSQNWQGHLMPATKMETGLSGVTSRMNSKAVSVFDRMRQDLEAVQSEGSWGEVVSK
ncbi:hypothetical protein GCM10007939_22220 [Amylibacter marinus]|uniref:Flp pilus-assembly TadE/G-like n=1 Tax=Amylibacter marinus TaxID=1475483 RepID=A0ABQ5VXX3_9RHOB|nr:hypothetical protein [Amylibacter marinus]GLQ35938.1 hypothetical protein GCM10007939_22220 [Amylibacter marinus]